MRDEPKVYKYQGAGNDFILLDCREHRVNLSKEQISKMRTEVWYGGRRIIYLEPQERERIIFIWSISMQMEAKAPCAGMEVDVLPNLLRTCMVAENFTFTLLTDLIGQKFRQIVALGMSDAKLRKLEMELFCGYRSPHHIELVEQHADDFIKFARPIRLAYGDKANVNSLAPLTKGFSIRTYERGVEDETLACGTGAVAAAMVAVDQGLTNSPVRISALGGELLVRFNGKGPFTEVILEGPASRSFEAFGKYD